MNIPELFADAGIVALPLLLLSILSLGVAIERIWFWSKILTHEREIAGRIIEAARRDWSAAADIAQKSNNQPIGRFLNSALEMKNPEPEVFQLALEAAADEELAAMQRGNKILESAIAIAPLLGLLGTVLGLIRSLGDIRLGDIITGSATGVTQGISEALVSTAFGLIVALTSLAFYRVFQGLVHGQAKLFRKSGNELELLYRKDWSIHKGKMDTTNPTVSEQKPAGGDFVTS
ncbi:MotA/TolQ/ExbB proton channel family protein [Oscillatoria sp. FACHB-1407]|uniref:MotA/TolQ/ExbB proton channel family protein n=1 Tax=Oscillatoria sp. FACHB-1407 TaxID=2692847 RepID=UPI00168837D0|nr:MotA/TolQ/ExbB proton channel family protein [Oscillatoria sp. FACHB-1407]MBD2461693.1 MotA/TolQ/ExbB proton channel family protein [Oscillatoria sp. FACHB-1407]